MNINCFQYKKLKDCIQFEIAYNTILGLTKDKTLVEVPITDHQYQQSHNELVYNDKWVVPVTNDIF